MLAFGGDLCSLSTASWAYLVVTVQIPCNPFMLLVMFIRQAFRFIIKNLKLSI